MKKTRLWKEGEGRLYTMMTMAFSIILSDSVLPLSRGRGGAIPPREIMERKTCHSTHSLPPSPSS